MLAVYVSLKTTNIDICNQCGISSSHYTLLSRVVVGIVVAFSQAMRLQVSQLQFKSHQCIFSRPPGDPVLYGQTTPRTPSFHLERQQSKEAILKGHVHPEMKILSVSTQPCADEESGEVSPHLLQRMFQRMIQHLCCCEAPGMFCGIRNFTRHSSSMGWVLSFLSELILQVFQVRTVSDGWIKVFIVLRLV